MPNTQQHRVLNLSPREQGVDASSESKNRAGKRSIELLVDERAGRPEDPLSADFNEAETLSNRQPNGIFPIVVSPALLDNPLFACDEIARDQISLQNARMSDACSADLSSNAVDSPGCVIDSDEGRAQVKQECISTRGVFRQSSENIGENKLRDELNAAALTGKRGNAGERRSMLTGTHEQSRGRASLHLQRGHVESNEPKTDHPKTTGGAQTPPLHTARVPAGSPDQSTSVLPARTPKSAADCETLMPLLRHPITATLWTPIRYRVATRMTMQLQRRAAQVHLQSAEPNAPDASASDWHSPTSQESRETTGSMFTFAGHPSDADADSGFRHVAGHRLENVAGNLRFSNRPPTSRTSSMEPDANPKHDEKSDVSLSSADTQHEGTSEAQTVPGNENSARVSSDLVEDCTHDAIHRTTKPPSEMKNTKFANKIARSSIREDVIFDPQHKSDALDVNGLRRFGK